MRALLLSLVLVACEPDTEVESPVEPPEETAAPPATPAVVSPGVRIGLLTAECVGDGAEPATVELPSVDAMYTTRGCADDGRCESVWTWQDGTTVGFDCSFVHLVRFEVRYLVGL